MTDEVLCPNCGEPMGDFSGCACALDDLERERRKRPKRPKPNFVGGMRGMVARRLERERQNNPDGAVKTPRPPRLTPAMKTELLAQRDKGPQATFGTHRARTQNVLCSRGLSAFRGDDGQTILRAGAAGFAATCEITEAGRRALEP